MGYCSSCRGDGRHVRSVGRVWSHRIRRAASEMGISVASVSLCFAVMWSAGWLRARGARTAAWTLLLLYVCALMIPGLLRPVSIDNVALLKSAEAHYSLTLAQGDRLAAGLMLGKDVNLNYGLGMTLFTAAFERSVRFLTFGEHIRLVQVFQVVFIVAAVAAFIIWTSQAVLGPGCHGFCGALGIDKSPGRGSPESGGVAQFGIPDRSPGVVACAAFTEDAPVPAPRILFSISRFAQSRNRNRPVGGIRSFLITQSAVSDGLRDSSC